MRNAGHGDLCGWAGKLSSVGIGLFATVSFLVAGSATAVSTSFTLAPFTGDPLEVTVTLDDGIVAGSVQLTATVSSGIGDFQGIFFDLTDDALLPGLTITGADLSSFVATGSVINLGGGNNLNGGGSPCPCDVGVTIGTPGIGTDDIQTTILLIGHDMLGLDLSDFAEQNFGARLTSVGDNRSGSSKLTGVVPEPGTALLVSAGLCALGASRRRGFGSL